MSRYFRQVWTDIYEDFDDLPIRRKQPQPDREPRRFPKRLKNEGSETANIYNQLALDTIGEEMWKQMKMGRLNWASIEDEHFAIAERLGQQLETYDPNEVVENNVSVPVVVEPEVLVQPKILDPQTKKPKKKRDRRIKTRPQDS
jgi:hypothetical protein